MSISPTAITQAKELLRTARHGAMATVNADGSPHNTPYHLLVADDLSYFYWSSKPEAVHSQNIERTGQAYVVVYDSFASNGGLYVQLEEAHKLQGAEVDAAIAAHTKVRAKVGKAPIAKEDYAKTGQVFYGAKPVKLWVYA